jgi:anti-sigma regulatory factor (Ser/Thr protein kinase)
MTSEVVTNAVRYSVGDVTFGMDTGSDFVRVEVGDTSAARPAFADTTQGAEGGRGLRIAAALASSWGVTDTRPGKVVWFEVPVEP